MYKILAAFAVFFCAFAVPAYAQSYLARIQEVATNAAASCRTAEHQALDDSLSIEEQLRKIDEAIACYETQNGAALSEEDAVTTLGIQSMISAQMVPLQERKVEVISQKEFLGLSFGIGLGFSVSHDDAIDAAELVNNQIVATSNREQLPRVLFEFHKYFKIRRSSTGTTSGMGPFVAVAAANDDLLSGVGLGVMYGMKTEKGESGGFSLGFGAILDGDVKDLARGFNEGRPLPDGETVIRFEEESRWSTILFFTRTF